MIDMSRIYIVINRKLEPYHKPIPFVACLSIGNHQQGYIEIICISKFPISTENRNEKIKRNDQSI